MEEIINKVAISALEVFDLEDIKGVRAQIDISQWLLEGFVERKGFLENISKITTGRNTKINLWLSIAVRVL
jgi:hypothetical protein